MIKSEKILDIPFWDSFRHEVDRLTKIILILRFHITEIRQNPDKLCL